MYDSFFLFLIHMFMFNGSDIKTRSSTICTVIKNELSFIINKIGSQLFKLGDYNLLVEKMLIFTVNDKIFSFPYILNINITKLIIKYDYMENDRVTI